ncbi:MAG: IS1634 family transposase [Desulfobacterales bacterium]|nr:IS1634 family transposase [Desulfobacterales bacterium]
MEFPCQSFDIWITSDIIVVTMYIIRPKKRVGDKTYTSTLLIEGYREHGKVKKRTIANLSKIPEKIITDIEAVLKGASFIQKENLKPIQGKAFGAIWVLNELCRALGISKVLGNTKNGMLAKLMILAKIINPSASRKAILSWIKDQAIEEVLGLTFEFDHYDLYKSLDWLENQQEYIEKKIFSFRNKTKKTVKIILYDITSSYLEGVKNELGAFGYNRDGKKGKMQIVIGLLCDDDGYPISIEVFHGNTSDCTTVENQLKKLKKTFEVSDVIFVGDRGMIKSGQVESILSEEYKWNFITAITKRQIKKLVKDEIFSLSDFTEEIKEIKYQDVRYILRRNPIRESEIRESRNKNIERVKKLAQHKSKYLAEHKRAKPEVSEREILDLISRRNLTKFTECYRDGRKIYIDIDDIELRKVEELDGCYTLKTNLDEKKYATEIIHSQYKDLSKVEYAFRTIKTGLLEIHPIYVRKDSRTRGHVFICMLSYFITKHLKDLTSSLDLTLSYTIQTLDRIQYTMYDISGHKFKSLPCQLTIDQENIFSQIGLKLPIKI